MLVEVKVPVLSESVAEATLVAWHKKIGESVKRSENLIDIETDKIVMEMPAPNAGVLKEIRKPDGSTVTSGEVIAVIDTDAAVEEAQDKESEETKPIMDIQPKESAASADKTITASQESQTESLLMPAARKLADDYRLNPSDIANIKGTGLGGRILKEDVQALVDKQATNTTEQVARATPPQSQAKSEVFLPQQSTDANQLPPSDSRKERRVPMSRLRQTIAQRLVQSQSTAAILTTFNEVNMQAVMNLRARYKLEFEKEYGVKLGFTSFFVKAVVAALKKFPIVNASVDGNDIIYHDYYDIGIAVGSSRGLVVPVIRNADQLTLAEIEKQIADFAKRAQEGKLTLEELSGGTFSITNGGVFGSMLSTPIINPPQSAILGIHATKDRPVVENGQIVVRPMNYLALSYDHRIIDGREAVLALVAMKEALEYPISPLLEA
ncbi:2-oxoglutarate dehydrogenase E2 component [Nitrosomonas sp. PY1]|uniref:2-oxoglutarate dehydrogenase complex dihydrolipoyllysine-residue succinyltransferase n=1 Tax=Nitrosomonas sp. PY1 TaxID=1803906 RepID=UPI001FC88C56|nr:2-oxoglutarate dehydrogenase complex dihydrolipoyllysine-residue succinyltransferase [Nitrosomonas sp. PY1]GKS69609.1 2-oxoglutarate dehydrogenase E2 component [Nitrosomonas sp. PY1]